MSNGKCCDLMSQSSVDTTSQLWYPPSHPICCQVVNMAMDLLLMAAII